MNRAHAHRPPRTAWLLAALALLAPGADAAPNQGQTLRILLFEGPGPVQVESLEVDRPAAELMASPEGVRANGGPPQRVWRSTGDGPMRTSGYQVRGALEVLPSAKGLVVVNEVPLEAYVVGTVGREMSASWNAEALRAQAVVTRTYALHQFGSRRARSYHLRADTANQVYGGVEAESPRVISAASRTRGEILTYRGAPILAAFHSASGGQTASAEEVWGKPLVYLVSLPVEGEDDSPDTYWRASISRPTLGRAAEALGRPVGVIKSLKVLGHSASGRVQKLELRGEGGEAIIAASELRRALGPFTLKSTLFEIVEQDGDFVFVGSGYGHGVGMSQWGARAMAEQGASYREILKAFYPGADLETLDELPKVSLGEGG